MSLYDCFEDVIGFTRAEDDCVTGFLPEYAESRSGLYLDKLQGMNLRIHDASGGALDVWEKLTLSRINAIDAFKLDVSKAMKENYEEIRRNFFGDIGGRGFTRIVPQSDYYGLRMYSDVRGGQFTLNAVSLILDTTENVDLLIYDEYDLLHTIPISSVAARPHRTDITPVILDTNGNYYFLIQPTGRPYKNKLTCGCGGYRWCFKPETPCYRYSRDKWTEWAMIGGISGTVLADRADWGIGSTSNGMVLHGAFNCNALDTLCSDDSDFVNNEIDLAIAYLILYKTAIFMTNYIIDTEEVNRYTLLGKDALIENREYYGMRYAEILDYVSGNIEIEKNECLRCKSPHGIGVRKQRL